MFALVVKVQNGEEKWILTFGPFEGEHNALWKSAQIKDEALPEGMRLTSITVSPFSDPDTPLATVIDDL